MKTLTPDVLSEAILALHEKLEDDFETKKQNLADAVRNYGIISECIKDTLMRLRDRENELSNYAEKLDVARKELAEAEEKLTKITNIKDHSFE